MEGKITYNYNNLGRNDQKESINKNVYWGVVVSIDDETDGGRIKVRINGIDNKILDNNLPYSYPLMPKFFHIYPKVGEIVRIFIEDSKFPLRSRYWIGSIISQPHKVYYDNENSALSTTNLGVMKPEKAPSEYHEADGVYPKKDEIAIVGRLNNDIILRDNEIELRIGKHVADNKFKLNKKNMGSIKMVFESNSKGEYSSSTVIMSDKIAIITHEGNPKFKSYGLTKEDRDRIFLKGSPLAKGRELIASLEIMRNAILNHVHPYDRLVPDKSNAVVDLEKINFENILNKNIVTN